jgi:hypothetical protein
MMAPFGPAPQIVSKLMSCSAFVARRKPSSACTTSISVSPPFGASRSSQHRNSTIAAPSRRCASRVAAISAAFLRALGRRQGSSPQATSTPRFQDIVAHGQRGPLALSTRTGPGSVPARGEGLRRMQRDARPQMRAHRVVSFAGSANRSTRPSSCRIAKPCTTGFFGTSAPRMFNSQQIESGSVSTAAFCPAWRSSARQARALVGHGFAGQSRRVDKGRPTGARADPARSRRPDFPYRRSEVTPVPSSAFSSFSISSACAARGRNPTTPAEAADALLIQSPGFTSGQGTGVKPKVDLRLHLRAVAPVDEHPRTSGSTMQNPADPVNPVSHCNRSSRAATYSP